MATTASATTTTSASRFTGFSPFELAFLLSNDSGAVAAKSREVFKLDYQADAPTELLEAGALSLLARGLLRIEGENAQPLGVAEAITYVMLEAVRWTQVGLINTERLDGAVFVKAQEYSLLCQPRMLGTWLVTVTDGEVSSANMVRRLFDAQESETEGDVGLSVVSSTLDSTSTIAMSRTKAKGLTVLVGESALHDEIEPRESTIEEIDGLLARLLNDQPIGA